MKISQITHLELVFEIFFHFVEVFYHLSVCHNFVFTISVEFHKEELLNGNIVFKSAKVIVLKRKRKAWKGHKKIKKKHWLGERKWS